MPTSSNIWIISGEASGDDYGAGLATSLKQLCPACTIRGMGGTKMRAAGVDIFVDSTELGVVGFIEVLRHISFFAHLLTRLTKMAAEEKPDIVVLIDYPGFNIRLANRLHNLGIKVAYYISPQVWAWKKGRIKTLEKCVDLMMCIFPFEPAVYQHTRLTAEFVGHPLLRRLAPYTETNPERNNNQILLLPGSRRNELSKLLPDFLKAAALLKQRHPALTFVLPAPRETIAAQAREILSSLPEIAATVQPVISVGNTRELMVRSGAALAASGTVTVEAAILDLPVVVAYRLSWLTWHLAKRLVKLPWVSITNLVQNKEVFQELLQDAATPENLAEAVERILPGTEVNKEIHKDLEAFRLALGGNKNVDEAVARRVLSLTTN